jgi:hypothetical protein
VRSPTFPRPRESQSNLERPARQLAAADRLSPCVQGSLTVHPNCGRSRLGSRRCQVNRGHPGQMAPARLCETTNLLGNPVSMRGTSGARHTCPLVPASCSRAATACSPAIGSTRQLMKKLWVPCASIASARRPRAWT